VRPVDLLGLPLLFLRYKAGAIRVFHNVCSHRGMQPVAAPCNVKTVLRCPYHGWAYGLDGALHATPNFGGVGHHKVDGFDRKAHGLKAVRSAVWFDLIFVNLSGDAQPFEEHIAPLADRWRAFDAGLLRHGGPDSSLELDVRCNWKLAVENNCDAGHLPWIHPGLNSYSRLEDHYNIEQDGLYAGPGSTVYRPTLAGGGTFPRFPSLPEHWKDRAEYVALFPNVLLGIHGDHFFAVWIEPLAPDRSLEHFEIYYVGEEPLGDDYADLRVANAAQWRTVFLEDVMAVEGMQRGRASPAFDGGLFSPVMDTPTHCFHRWVASTMARGHNAES
jgi:choline monooxygenase